jgi:protein-arginine kinase activator protein McsA
MKDKSDRKVFKPGLKPTGGKVDKSDKKTLKEQYDSAPQASILKRHYGENFEEMEGVCETCGRVYHNVKNFGSTRCAYCDREIPEEFRLDKDGKPLRKRRGLDG